MTVEARAAEPSLSWLAHVPVPLFAVSMGLGGLGLAWRRAHAVLDWPAAVGEAIVLLAAVCFAAITVLYGLKALRFPDAVRADFAHPVRVNFFPAASISLLLLAAGALPYGHGLAEAVWLTGTVLQLVLALTIFARWITRNVEIQQASPAWFIPVVGNILVPIAGGPLGHIEVSWFFFYVGLVFWLVLFTIVLYRIIFHDQMPGRFLPTLFILMAPPAIGCVAYGAINGGGLDPLVRLLFFTALFIALLLAAMARLFVRLPYAVSWWAYTFPSASLAGAALHYHALIGGWGSTVLAVVILLAATAIIALVAVRTVAALVQGRIFVPE